MAIIVACGSVPLIADAQTSSNQGGVTLSPSFKELTLGPGLLEAKTTVSVRNTTNKELTAQIRLVDFSALDEFGGVSLSQVDAPLSEYSLAKWMSLPNGTLLTLPRNQDVNIPITIRNDNELSPGGHYGAAIISVSSDQKLVANEIAFKQELASLLFVKKTGGETYGLELESIKPENLPNIPKTVSLKFKSTGNVHVVPRGYIELTDPKGMVVAKGIINPESTLVMPDTSRQFVAIIEPIAESKVKGEYKLTAYYRYDGLEEFQSQTISFRRGSTFVSTSIILLVSIFLTGLVTWFFRKKFPRKFKSYKKLG